MKCVSFFTFALLVGPASLTEAIPNRNADLLEPRCSKTRAISVATERKFVSYSKRYIGNSSDGFRLPRRGRHDDGAVPGRVCQSVRQRERRSQHFRERELIDHGEDGRACSTRDRDESYLGVWIEPRWGTVRIDETGLPWWRSGSVVCVASRVSGKGCTLSSKRGKGSEASRPGDEG